MGTASPPPSSDGKSPPAYLARKQTTPDGKVQQTVTFVLRGLLGGLRGGHRGYGG